jgi:hypothetical protein
MHVVACMALALVALQCAAAGTAPLHRPYEISLQAEGKIHRVDPKFAS